MIKTNDKNNIVSYRNSFFLYSIHPAVKIFIFFCWLKIILGLNFALNFIYKDLVNIFFYIIILIVNFFLILWLLQKTNYSWVKLLKKFSHLNWLIILSLIWNLSTVSKSSDDIKIFMWNNFYIWCLITLLFFIFKYYFVNGFYSYFFLIIIFLLPRFFVSRSWFINETQILFLSSNYIWKTFFVIIRILMIFLVFALFSGTTSFMEINDGLEFILKPLKKINFPLETLTMLLSLIYMFIPFLLSESQKIIKAQTSRGIDLNTQNIFKKIYYFIALLIPIFVLSFQKSSILANAMESRGYVLGAPRTKLTYYCMSYLDYLILFFHLLLLCWSFFV
ncbi:energy-coupling factor transporter transmembrane protein EcfT ['Opuntia sp.' phytoplasma]|uniref:energy-coupling factor transporter transmembrane component T family protein n=1 Tax=Candidatus Phytoplasma asiaticum TaxID=2763338 RepID=UPI00271418D0|nr:energy-coupling factor transporter transmembrane component T ['Opuntia sp.' phytoplasma]MDO8053953.1 energy-coupling factor transporter transmembrane protein EcfT ['Opuntia sp.' phytoplasma]MDO8057668.1 energy-coupling factor transporter transmembrane protein EcfT ['Opuntia sp.' phytoplasma]